MSDAPISLFGSAEVIWYPDQFSRAIQTSVAKRVREAANMLRRTLRLAVNQKGPRRREKSGWVVIGRSLPGEVPFRESGSLYSHVGYDFRNDKATFEIDGTISVESHGLELGRTSNPGGVKRPHLLPAWNANRALMIAIVEGRTSAPQYGDLSYARHRQALQTYGKNGGIAAAKASGRLSFRLRFSGVTPAGGFRPVRGQAIRRAKGRGS